MTATRFTEANGVHAADEQAPTTPPITIESCAVQELTDNRARVTLSLVLPDIDVLPDINAAIPRLRELIISALIADPEFARYDALHQQYAGCLRAAREAGLDERTAMLERERLENSQHPLPNLGALLLAIDGRISEAQARRQQAEREGERIGELMYRSLARVDAQHMTGVRLARDEARRGFATLADRRQAELAAALAATPLAALAQAALADARLKSHGGGTAFNAALTEGLLAEASKAFAAKQQQEEAGQ